MAFDERRPLLGDDAPDGQHNKDDNDKASRSRALLSPANRILFAGCLVALTLGMTQVPIIYAFRVMACDAFYGSRQRHHGQLGPGIEVAAGADRCSRSEVDAATATQVAILRMTTSVCGIANLFVCGVLIERLGTAWGFVVQTSLLAVRVACQSFAIALGGRDGIVFMQLTQLTGVIGGPRGYVLILNTAISEVVEKKEHTKIFGRLQGVLMIGRAVGSLLGGVLGDAFGIKSPFIAGAGCLVAGTFYGAAFMPRPAASREQEANDRGKGKAPSGFFAPLKVLVPRRFRLESGKVVKHYGLAFLALGVFFGVFATGDAPILIQMYATSRFRFGTTENGILMSGNAFVNGAFLMFLYPVIIDAGRKWMSRKEKRAELGPGMSVTSEDDPLLASRDEPEPEPEPEPESMLGPNDTDEPQESSRNEHGEDEEDSTFDLMYLRWSLVVDSFVTSICAWATERWHMYLAAFLLPLASGSAPAAKGVITEMCPPYMRREALGAIALVDSAATLLTQGLFNLIYALFSALGRGNLTFVCNGGVALVAFGILLFANYPPPGSQLVNPDDRDDIVVDGGAETLRNDDRTGCDGSSRRAG